MSAQSLKDWLELNRLACVASDLAQVGVDDVSILLGKVSELFL